MAVGLRRAVAWTVEKPIPRFAPVTRMISGVAIFVSYLRIKVSCEGMEVVGCGVSAKEDGFLQAFYSFGTS